MGKYYYPARWFSENPEGFIKDLEECYKRLLELQDDYMDDCRHRGFSTFWHSNNVVMALEYGLLCIREYINFLKFHYSESEIETIATLLDENRNLQIKIKELEDRI